MVDNVYQLIERTIKERADSYTPEWRFDVENPDIGSALAMVYAKMFAETVKRFSKVMAKNQIAFLNELDAQLLPAVPSNGYLQFSLVNEETDGVEVLRGTTVFANVNGIADGQVTFETQEDLFVTPAQMKDIYQVFDLEDKIVECYNSAKESWKPFSMFRMDGKNLQKHIFYFSQKTMLHVKEDVEIELFCFIQENLPLQKIYRNALADDQMAVFEYYSEKEWCSFAEIDVTETGLLLKKDRKQPAFVATEIEGIENYWIRCRVKQFAPFDKLSMKKMEILTRGTELTPDVIYSAQEECNRYRYLPFGERLELYQEVYFGSEEVLSKKGAEIVFCFNLAFRKVPLDTNNTEPLQWEWIMKRSDFKIDQEFDVTIEEVVWEYYNGYGWTRLFEEDDNKQIFSVQNGIAKQYRKLIFVCPDDMEKTLVNANETYYIRARITKINNLYKMNGNYVIPLVENTSFQYTYKKMPQKTDQMIFQNNMDHQIVLPEDMRQTRWKPFYQTELEGLGTYLGFVDPPIGSPLKMFLSIANDRDRAKQHLAWEYWNGGCWKSLNYIDETAQLSRSGLFTFTGNTDMARRRLFGKERFWIRVRDIENAYVDQKEVGRYPVIDAIEMNTTKIQNVDRREEEYFQMEIYQEEKHFSLLGKNIYEAVVYVDETGYLSQSEIQHLRKLQLLRMETDESGLEIRSWVKWNRVNDFSDSGPADRHFVIYETEGKLAFGDGKHGKIPYAANYENIYIQYRGGGGVYTNLPEGSIDKLENSIGYIDNVRNIGSTLGGEDTEKLQDAIERNAASIRHQHRAVSVRDYEELARSASREVQYAKCFSGFDDKGEKRDGAVTLVVLQRQYLSGRKYFHVLRDKILQYMKERISTPLLDNQRFFVIQPNFVEVKLFIELSVRDFNQVFEVKREILERFQKFFDPFSKEAEHLEHFIGQFPDNMQLQNVISGVQGVQFIQKIMMKVYDIDSEEKDEIDVEHIKRKCYLLPVNGKHEVVINVVS